MAPMDLAARRRCGRRTRGRRAAGSEARPRRPRGRSRSRRRPPAPAYPTVRLPGARGCLQGGVRAGEPAPHPLRGGDGPVSRSDFRRARRHRPACGAERALADSLRRAVPDRGACARHHLRSRGLPLRGVGARGHGGGGRCGHPGDDPDRTAAGPLLLLRRPDPGDHVQLRLPEAAVRRRERGGVDAGRPVHRYRTSRGRNAVADSDQQRFLLRVRDRDRDVRRLLLRGAGSAQLRSSQAGAREFGSYRLVAPLGRGGMGEVWRAEHQLLARPAAIKLIRPEMLGAADAEGRRATLRRFEREAQATAQLRSPHTIQLYDFGVTEEGTFYYVMELLEGYDLETVVQRFGPLPCARAVQLLVQVCHSLAEAHERGLIHRDIKPANIYLCRYGRATDFVKVLDFGLVKSWRQPDPTEVGATKGGVITGTPSCMAPEQIAGDRPLDARTDIYGVGCVAYWLLTGQQVFEGTSAMRVMTHHLETPPTAPSARSDRPIPPGLDAVVLTCLEKDPDHRPQTTDVLAERLVSCGAGQPWSAKHAHAWWGEHAPSPSGAPWTGEQRLVMPSLAEPWSG